MLVTCQIKWHAVNKYALGHCLKHHLNNKVYASSLARARMRISSASSPPEQNHGVGYDWLALSLLSGPVVLPRMEHISIKPLLSHPYQSDILQDKIFHGHRPVYVSGPKLLALALAIITRSCMTALSLGGPTLGELRNNQDIEHDFHKENWFMLKWSVLIQSKAESRIDVISSGQLSCQSMMKHVPQPLWNHVWNTYCTHTLHRLQRSVTHLHRN